MRIRFSIAGLMAVVLIVAVGFAGLRAASSLWASAVFSAAVTLFATALLGAAARRGPARMVWLGFCVFGWTYLLATFWLWPERKRSNGPTVFDEGAARLLAAGQQRNGADRRTRPGGGVPR